MHKYFFLFFSVVILNVHGQESKDIHQILLYKWSKNVPKNGKFEFLKIFDSLPLKIEGINNISINSFKKSTGNFDVIIDMEFSSMETLQQYLWTI
ncbi:hypothetical protein FVB32_08435 [Flagellimonas hymeniacidonis]|uniref:Stress-response A/B barrel domain-containing protein n=1 Tax=Flagellimonas hymeniacidonis TaxID=2603628 RepID=A0A5C8VBX5_9FLAO|nr:hypothetical protein FVB32_08435 [Flagellimonas hymeniacidonis]